MKPEKVVDCLLTEQDDDTEIDLRDVINKSLKLLTGLGKSEGEKKVKLLAMKLFQKNPDVLQKHNNKAVAATVVAVALQQLSDKWKPKGTQKELYNFLTSM